MDQTLSQLAQALPEAQSVETVTRPLLEIIQCATGLESTYLTEIDLVGSVQHVRYARNVGTLQIPEGLSVPWSDTLCKRALDEGRVCTTDVSSCWGDSEAARVLGIRTYVSTPVRNTAGDLIGTLCAASAASCPIGPNVSLLLQLFSSLIAVFIEREHLVTDLQAANQQLSALALNDLLTGLPNRRALFDAFHRLRSHARRDQASILVGLIDLDGFKRVNDAHGHQVGDWFLQEVARRLPQGVREHDIVGRLGGDEFLAFGLGPALDAAVDGVPGAAALAGFHERLSRATVGTYVLGDVVLDYPGASVGVVAVSPDYTHVEEAVRLADAEMYRIKQARKAARGSADFGLARVSG